MKAFDPQEFLKKVHYRAIGSTPDERIDSTCKDILLLVLYGKGEDFCRRIYAAILGRAPDATGVAAYLPRSTSLWGRVSIALSLALSNERRQHLHHQAWVRIRDEKGDLQPREGAGARWLRIITDKASRLKQRVVSRKARLDARTVKQHDDAPMAAFYAAFEDAFRDSPEVLRARQEQRYGARARQMLPLGKRAIDLGCGRGEWLECLAGWGFEAEGVDKNAHSIAAAQARGLRIANVDMWDYLRAQPDESVALISAFHVIEHLSFVDLWHWVGEVHRVLVPGGLCLLETPNTRNVLVSAGDFYRDPTHCQHIFPDTLNFLMRYRKFEGDVFFFDQAQHPVPHGEARLDCMEDYLQVSRDMAYMGVKR